MGVSVCVFACVCVVGVYVFFRIRLCIIVRVSQPEKAFDNVYQVVYALFSVMDTINPKIVYSNGHWRRLVKNNGRQTKNTGGKGGNN